MGFDDVIHKYPMWLVEVVEHYTFFSLWCIELIFPLRHSYGNMYVCVLFIYISVYCVCWQVCMVYTIDLSIFFILSKFSSQISLMTTAISNYPRVEHLCRSVIYLLPQILLQALFEVGLLWHYLSSILSINGFANVRALLLICFFLHYFSWLLSRVFI